MSQQEFYETVQLQEEYIMTQQPEALRLADALMADNYGAAETQIERRAAAELRRLHEVNQEWEKICDQHLRHIKKLKKQLAKATGENNGV